ncbi:hypothetical protein M441DRAFT_294264 [Trichoderma asperellum CBS 433.97]|uniref:Transmembrane protein n=1 Tax=Trichoderma asperellum (strain ATCC 204424 / CBS 433.97 / NBRC 101777) TaxID=1042311 RepID=A0A2T3YTC1_TRIA4|nr:hypothetical protein M441DRAFT_294264 [Trichoderma asperellum CBS 433.97]PTB35815.1 hypothetical protein M441DRAFT_294264 [Trichoderma asperellum CBS 433.97]
MIREETDGLGHSRPRMSRFRFILQDHTDTTQKWFIIFTSSPFRLFFFFFVWSRNRARGVYSKVCATTTTRSLFGNGGGRGGVLCSGSGGITNVPRK